MPGPAAESSSGWAFLPPLQRTIRSATLTSRPIGFLSDLPTRQALTFTAAMSHVVDSRAPSGSVASSSWSSSEDAAPVQRSADVDLALLPPAPVDAARVRRDDAVSRTSVQRAAGSMVRLDAPPPGVRALRTVVDAPAPDWAPPVGVQPAPWPAAPSSADPGPAASPAQGDGPLLATVPSAVDAPPATGSVVQRTPDPSTARPAPGAPALDLAARPAPVSADHGAARRTAEPTPSASATPADTAAPGPTGAGPTGAGPSGTGSSAAGPGGSASPASSGGPTSVEPASGSVLGAPVVGAPVVGAPVVGAPVVGAPVVGAPVVSRSTEPPLAAPRPVSPSPALDLPVTPPSGGPRQTSGASDDAPLLGVGAAAPDASAPTGVPSVQRSAGDALLVTRASAAGPTAQRELPAREPGPADGPTSGTGSSSTAPSGSVTTPSTPTVTSAAATPSAASTPGGTWSDGWSSDGWSAPADLLGSALPDGATSDGGATYVPLPTVSRAVDEGADLTVSVPHDPSAPSSRGTAAGSTPPDLTLLQRTAIGSTETAGTPAGSVPAAPAEAASSASAPTLSSAPLRSAPGQPSLPAPGPTSAPAPALDLSTGSPAVSRSNAQTRTGVPSSTSLPGDAPRSSSPSPVDAPLLGASGSTSHTGSPSGATAGPAAGLAGGPAAGPAVQRRLGLGAPLPAAPPTAVPFWSSPRRSVDSPLGPVVMPTSDPGATPRRASAPDHSVHRAPGHGVTTGAGPTTPDAAGLGSGEPPVAVPLPGAPVDVDLTVRSSTSSAPADTTVEPPSTVSPLLGAPVVAPLADDGGGGTASPSPSGGPPTTGLLAPDLPLASVPHTEPASGPSSTGPAVAAPARQVPVLGVLAPVLQRAPMLAATRPAGGGTSAVFPTSGTVGVRSAAAGSAAVQRATLVDPGSALDLLGRTGDDRSPHLVGSIASAPSGGAGPVVGRSTSGPTGTGPTSSGPGLAGPASHGSSPGTPPHAPDGLVLAAPVVVPAPVRTAVEQRDLHVVQREPAPAPAQVVETPTPAPVPVQRAEPPAPVTAEQTTAPPEQVTPPADPDGGPPGSVFAGASAADIDDLARRLTTPMLRRLRGQLLVDRERRGLRADVR